jgi:SAM-dependent methyltransferase
MQWPKTRPVLSAQEESISEDWQAFWLTAAQKKFSGIQNFNHGYALRASAGHAGETLEVGAGDGEHIRLEQEGGRTLTDYHVIEMREDLADVIRRRFPALDVKVADCQKSLPFESVSIRRIVAIHVLEHLDNLPVFLREAGRVLASDGRLIVVLPCEGGLLYGLGRQVTTKRLFKKRYGISYEKFIRCEHVNTASEVIAELKKSFRIESSEWWPLKIPSVHMNVCVGLCLVPNAATPRDGKC